MRERPLSPHLSVYKFKYTLLSSITNRLTGIALSVGLIVLAYWLISVAAGPVAYERASALLSHGIFKLFYAGVLFAFLYHFVAGLRHLIWDTGAGMEKRQSQQSAWIVGGVALLLFVVLAYCLFSGVI